jgi:hypothetical protein
MSNHDPYIVFKVDDEIHFSCYCRFIQKFEFYQVDNKLALHISGDGISSSIPILYHPEPPVKHKHAPRWQEKFLHFLIKEISKGKHRDYLEIDVDAISKDIFEQENGH